MSSGQLSFGDPALGNQLRDEAIARADEHADDRWKAVAYEMVAGLAATGLDFTTDDVWELMGDVDCVTHEPRALGGIILRASRAGLIRKTGDYRQSERPECHRNPKAVWTGTNPKTGDGNADS